MTRKSLKSKAPITPNSHFAQEKKKNLSFLLSLFLSIVGTPKVQSKYHYIFALTSYGTTPAFI
jgi:hypothetical protein